MQRPSTGLARPASSMSVAAGQFFEGVEHQQRSHQAPSVQDHKSAERMYHRSMTREAMRSVSPYLDEWLGPVPAAGSAVGGRQSSAGQRGPVARPASGMPRPGSRVGTAMGGGGPARVGTGMRVSERPVTQQGLSGVRPKTGGLGARQVQDKSYWMGLLRGKLNELGQEVNRLTGEVEHFEAERASFAVYEAKAESLAKELREEQGVLADYNLVIDKMNTNTEPAEVEAELEQLRQANEEEQRVVDGLFAERRDKEAKARQAEVELDEKRRQAESMMSNMDPGVRDRYETLKHENEELGGELVELEEELRNLSQKKGDLEDELTVSTIKQEAMLLHERLAEAEGKRDAILAEVNADGTPEQQRERVLAKVRQDNEEMAAIERQIGEAREKRESALEEIRELEEELQDAQGEKNEKYRELRLKETQIDEFLENFESSKREEAVKVERLQTGVTAILATISANVADDELSLQAGLAMDDANVKGFKRGPRNTVPELQEEIRRLEDELERLEEMETKAEEESVQLKTKLHEMAAEMDKFKDIDGLRETAAAKQASLEAEKERLEASSQDARQRRHKAAQDLDALKRKLNDNDDYHQIVNLEKKLQYVEQSNFTLREVVEARQAETNVGPVREQTMALVKEHNARLCAAPQRSHLVA